MASEINEKTRIPLGLVAGLLVAVGSALVWGNNELRDMRGEMEAMNARLETLTSEMGARWTIAAQSEFALRLQSANPEIHVPDPRDPSRNLR